MRDPLQGHGTPQDKAKSERILPVAARKLWGETKSLPGWARKWPEKARLILLAVPPEETAKGTAESLRC